MTKSNYSVYNYVEPPKLFKDNPNLLLEMWEDFNNLEDFKFSDNSSGIRSPFENTASNNFNFGFDIPLIDFNIEEPTFNYKPTPKKRFSSKSMSKKDYIETLGPYLYEALANNDIDPDKWTPILIALTAHESGWGNEFSRRTNNFGGIKGKGSGLVTTKEYSPSKGYYPIQSSFKTYPSIAAFADEYVKKLKNRFKAFNGSPSLFAANIRRHGYFTAKLSDYLNALNRILKDVLKYISL